MKPTARAPFWRRILAISGLAPALPVLATEPAPPAARAVNLLGMDLHRQIASATPDANVLLSPYSLQVSLAMTYAGANGATRSEMARVLHYGNDEMALHAGFQSIGNALRGAATQSTNFSFNVANRLFGHEGLILEKPFQNTLSAYYQAPLETVRFANPFAAARRINEWVAAQTRNRIQDLVSPSLLNADTRLVLVNALHLKAPWLHPFTQGLTKPRPFHLLDGSQLDTATMHVVEHFGFQQFDGFRAVALPYSLGDLQFVVLVPNQTNGLANVESKLTPEILSACRTLPFAELDLYFPRLKVSPPSMPLRKPLQALGLRNAFGGPNSTADFSRMTDPNRDPLAISEVIQRTFLALDEKGTEAATATAVAMVPLSAAPIKKPKPIVVRVDRPFVFFLQHRESGTCLFLGRIVDPR